MALEIEKRILLKKFPKKTEFSETHIIEQYYGPTGRLRRSEILIKGKTKRCKPTLIVKYVRTKKKLISKGVNQEIEVEISKSAFNKEVKKCTRCITKTRYIKKVGKYKWEVDVFNGLNLIIAEIEVKTKRELKTVKIPNFIKSEMIIDVTGIKQFSNFSLSWKKKI